MTLAWNTHLLDLGAWGSGLVCLLPTTAPQAHCPRHGKQALKTGTEKHPHCMAVLWTRLLFGSQAPAGPVKQRVHAAIIDYSPHE